MSAIGSASGAGTHASAQLAQQVGVAVASKVQDAAKAQGEAAVSLIQDAAAVAKQSVAEPGRGSVLDVHG